MLINPSIHWLVSGCTLLFPLLCQAKPLMLLSPSERKAPPSIYIANCSTKNNEMVLKVDNIENVENLKILFPAWDPKDHTEIIDWIYHGIPSCRLQKRMQEDEGYAVFIKQQLNRVPLIYALVAETMQTGTKSITKMDCLDPRDLKIVSSYAFPQGYSFGQIISGPVYYDRQWRWVLMVALKAQAGDQAQAQAVDHARDQEQRADCMLIFDITDPKKKLSCQTIELQAQKLNENVKPQSWRLADKRWYLAMVVEGDTKAIMLISLDDINRRIFLTPVVHSNVNPTLSNMTAIDTETKTMVNRVYTLDVQGNVSVFNMAGLCADKHCKTLKSSHQGEYLGSIAEQSSLNHKETAKYEVAKPMAKARVIPDPNVPGLLVHFLNKTPHSSNISILRDPFNDRSVHYLPLKESSLIDFFIREGQLIALSNHPKMKPYIFNWSNKGWKEKEMPKDRASAWKDLGSIDLACRSDASAGAQEIVDAQWLWDPHKQMDILITLEKGCKLNFSGVHLNPTKIPYLMWRKSQ